MGNMSELPGRVRHRLSTDDFNKMVAAGVFAEDDRVELLDGELVDMAPIGSRHGGIVKRLNQHFSLTLGKRILVSTQDPLMLGTDSEPQPDLMLLKPRDDFYAGAHPQAGDVLLLIEVADSTVRFDREIKLPLYARHGINEVWLFDLEAGQCEVCRDPRPALSAYASRQLRGDGQLAPMALPECVLTLDPLFGR